MTNQNNQDKQAFEIGWDFIQLGYSIMPERTQLLFDLTMNLGMAKIKDTMRDLGIDLPFPGEDNEGADERDERDGEQTGEKPVAAWLDEFLSSREDTPDGEETDDDEEDDEPLNPMVSVREGDRWGPWQPVRSANAEVLSNPGLGFLSSEERRQAAENARLEAEDHAAEAHRARKEAEDNYKQAQSDMDLAISRSIRAEKALKEAESRAEEADRAAKEQRPMDGLPGEVIAEGTFTIDSGSPLMDILRNLGIDPDDDE